MYATRVPAMQKAKIDPQSAIHPGALSVLPANVRVVADNYNHLHEQPTIFYALAIYTHLAGAGGGAGRHARMGLCRPARRSLVHANCRQAGDATLYDICARIIVPDRHCGS